MCYDMNRSNIAKKKQLHGKNFHDLLTLSAVFIVNQLFQGVKLSRI